MLLDIFNNYLWLRSTTTPTGKLHEAYQNVFLTWFLKVHLITAISPFNEHIYLNIKLDVLFLCIFTLPKYVFVCLYIYACICFLFLIFKKKKNISNFVNFFFLFSKFTKRQFVCLILNIINGKELLMTYYLSLYPCLIKYCPTSVYQSYRRFDNFY